MKKIAGSVFILFTVMFPLASVHAEEVSFTVLRYGIYSDAHDVSADGSTVISDISSGAAMWQNGRLETSISAPSSYGTITGRVISGNGHVAGGYCYNTGGVDDEAFIHTNGQTTLLGRLPNTQLSRATGLNMDGSIAVGYCHTAGSFLAFYWKDNQMVQLPDLPGGRDDSYMAMDISAGDLIVGHGNGLDGTEACLWTNGQPQGLGVLNGFDYSMAHAISSNGMYIAGKNAHATAPQDAEAFIWTQGQMASLGVISGFNQSIAEDVSNNGVVVGHCITSSYEREAFLWDSEHGMRSLKDILNSCGVRGITDWQLQYATGISDDGLTIVGDGLDPQGYRRAWVVTIPEPTTIALLSLGGLALIRMRKQKSIH